MIRVIKRIVLVLVFALPNDARLVVRFLEDGADARDPEFDSSPPSIIQRLLQLGAGLGHFRSLGASHAPTQQGSNVPTPPSPLRSPVVIPQVATTPIPRSAVTFGTKLAEVLEVFFILGLVVGLVFAIYLYRSHNVPLGISTKVLKEAVELRYQRAGGYGSASDQRVVA